MTQTQLANELTLGSQVSEAVQPFAQALVDTLEFRAFEEGYGVFKQDRAAQQAVHLFEEKQRSLQMMQRLGMLEQKELDELKRLREAMTNQPSVRAYVDAQNELTRLCQAVAQELSAAIDLDFAGACASGCCG